MENVNQIVESALRSDKFSPEGVIAQLLGEESQVKVGDTVAIVDMDTSYGMTTKGKVTNTVSNKGSGFVDVKLANGNVMPMQSSLLVPVGGKA